MRVLRSHYNWRSPIHLTTIEPTIYLLHSAVEGEKTGICTTMRFTAPEFSKRTLTDFTNATIARAQEAWPVNFLRVNVYDNIA